QPSPRHGELGLAEAAGQRARAVAVPVANEVCRSAVCILCAPIPRASERRIELTPDKFFDELTHPFAHTALDRIKPVVEKVGRRLSCRRERISSCGKVGHMAWSPFRRSNAG